MMKVRNWLSALFLCGACLACHTGERPPELHVRYAAKAEAESLIADADDFSEHLNQFDLNVRLQKTGATKAEWKKLVRQETLEWSEQDLARMQMAFDTIESHIARLELDIPFPQEIVMLKTSMQEEMGAGAYTRRNWIAIGAHELQRATDAQLTQLAAHELFHVLSRHDAAFKKKVYRIFGFESTGHEFVFEDDADEKRITNPDIAFRDSYIPLTVEGRVQKCVEFIYADHDYDGGDIFDCLRVGFIPLDDQLQPVVSDSGTVIYPMAQVAEEFQSKIGKNTSYVIDPEEISAEHFSFLVTEKKNLPNPEYIEAMKAALQKK